MSQPSPSELTILKALWRSSPLSAREIQDQVGAALDWSFSTTRTTLTRMQDKGLVEKTRLHGVQVYAPGQSKAATLSTLMRDFFGQVLELKGPLPTAAFKDSAVLNEDELAELDALLNEEAQDD